MIDVAVIAFVIGFLVGGYILTRVIYYLFEVGTLRIDTSDPDGSTYMFLELDKGVGDVSVRPYVLLRVNLDSYLPRK